MEEWNVRREHLQVLARAAPQSVRENILVDVENIEGDCSSPSDPMTKTPGSGGATAKPRDGGPGIRSGSLPFTLLATMEALLEG